MPAQRRDPRWTEEEDNKLLQMVAAGKSWTLISAILRRGMAPVKVRARELRKFTGEE